MKTAGSVFIILFMLIACSEDSDMDGYNSLVKMELASNKKVDSIFFGFHFGMTQKDFYKYCWEMNKKGIFTDGTQNMHVLYKLDKELKFPASMNFFPDFHDSTIWNMRVNYQYDGWMPWNKALGADSLLQDVLVMYKKWYSEGNSFIQMNDKENGLLYVKVDGNRRIRIRKSDDVAVKVDITDIPVEKLIKKKDAK
ncbi:MAG: hypothetical protein ACSLE0_11830 [Chitinophagaceae bacterium]